MLITDNVDVRIRQFSHDSDRDGQIYLKQLKTWLNERNIKYSMKYSPQWVMYPVAINMRKEDALIFKLTFNL